MKKFTLTILAAAALWLGMSSSSMAGPHIGIYFGGPPVYYAPAPYYYGPGPYYGPGYYGYYGPHYYWHRGYHGYHGRHWR